MLRKRKKKKKRERALEDPQESEGVGGVVIGVEKKELPVAGQRSSSM